MRIVSVSAGGYTLLEVNSPLIESTTRELHASLPHSEGYCYDKPVENSSLQSLLG